MGLIIKPLISIVANAAALYLMLRFVPEISYEGGWMFFLIASLVLGIINTFIKPIVRLFSGPIVFLTAGLFLIVINVGVLWFLEYFLEVLAFRDVALNFPNFASYVIAAIVFGVINWLLHLFD
jgi:putative membrane protein